ncbi:MULTISPECIES: calcium:proton antiporter [unclassified Pseudovibrio]|uniref:calcium:proton antiporter n=1 Tax=unclassified Pseudovibrio TaxID=2627060 RepID=UPI0007AE57FE|nr:MULTISPECIES: calcium:proton antiporter [unclassified Pseudovibrio]KZL19720.1 Sodium/proton antiporter ChaA [Pseudovibrio sp. WM33]KZL26879.1 Sodium/proton antiporter ChaA [Pseudovibrio sp. Ad37]
MSGFWNTLKREACFLAGAATTAFFFLAGADLLLPTSGLLVQMFCFIWLFGVMLWCAFGVVRHADCLAVILGEPYGTLILTLSVIGIEVSLIVSIMLTGGTNEPLARDTMLAVLNIVLNGMVGISLLLGGLKYGEQPFNTQGARSFLSVLIPLATFSLILPRYTTSTADPSLSTGQQISFAVMISLLYAIFLATQSIRHKSFFIQPKPHSGVALSFLMAKDEVEDDKHAHDEDDHHDLEIYSTGYHATFLILTMLPIVLLSKKFAVLVDFGIASFHMPAAFGGVLVALLVLTPEGLGSFRAALSNRLQRSVNICLGSALATIGLTVPAVLIAAGIFDIHIVLGVKDTDMILLLLTLILSMITFTGSRTNALQGAVHLVLFIFYFILIFQP